MTSAIQLFVAAALIALLLPVNAAAQDWQPITGEEALREFVSGSTVTWNEGNPSHRAEYRADGTARLHAWGGEFERRWETKGDDQLCFYGEPESNCYTLERSTADPSLYRVTDVATGEVTEIRDAGGNALVATATPVTVANQAGPGTASESEMAAKLLNPANPIMKLGNNFDYVTFKGDLPGASDQSQFKYLFLTVFPFKLNNGNSILFRPGLPLIFDQGIPNNHFYGADLCLQCKKKGMKSYAISAYVHHNSTSRWVESDFYKAAEALYKKYPEELPIATTCIVIEDEHGHPKFRTDLLAMVQLTTRAFFKMPKRATRRNRPGWVEPQK
jgi:hypothetical protein